MPPTADDARRFLAESQFVWHQAFELVPGVLTPGVSKVAWLCDTAGIPADLTGQTVLDIGTTNAGTAFELERRGAARVVAVDIFEPSHFGVDRMIEFLGSSVEFQQSTVYELGQRFPDGFDLVVFWGVLYHLRHPLLALDNVRAVTRGWATLETAVCDSELPRSRRDASLARFYRHDELSGDSSNWFAPTTAALEAWCGSSGFDVQRVGAWPQRAPERAMLKLRLAAGEPEWRQLSYELPLRVLT